MIRAVTHLITICNLLYNLPQDVGRATFDGKNYRFAYIQGVKKAQAESNFRLLHSFPERDRLYTSSSLFPCYLATDISKILNQNPQSVIVSVERVNPAPTPIQFRLLCNMTAKSSDDFVLLKSEDYQPVIDS